MPHQPVDKMILVADIGGTNARFACAHHDTQEGWRISNFEQFHCKNFPTFEAAFEHYLSSLSTPPVQACFAVAGVVNENSVDLTNNDWKISANNVQSKYNIQQCELINDFSGTTRSVPELSKNDFEYIREGGREEGMPILVAGPGTGFGVGYLIPLTTGWHVVPTEGGHQLYAPQNELEFELLRTLQEKYEFVSQELVCSGKGLPVIHRAICEIYGQDYDPLHPDGIRLRAAEGDPVCLDICNVRAAATMGTIGDLALSGGARGGIVLAGGVSERMMSYYKKPENMQRFLNRGSHSRYVGNISMQLLKSPKAPLIGAAAYMANLQN